MIGSRGVLAAFLAVSFVTMILMGFSDKLNGRNTRNELCKLGHIDACARSGGLNR